MLASSATPVPLREGPCSVRRVDWWKRRVSELASWVASPAGVFMLGTGREMVTSSSFAPVGFLWKYK